MRLNLWWLATSPALFALGCAGGPTAPAESPAPAAYIPEVTLGQAVATPGGIEMALGQYTIGIDRANLTASVTPRVVRSAEAAGATTYELCVSDFFPTPPLKITNLEINGGDLTLHYAITHPFSAPTNLDAPASASNRADLGISGSAIFLVDGIPGGVPRAVEFFNGEMICAPDLVTNEDYYRTPHDKWIELQSFTCDTFPCKMLVNESDPECRTSSSTGAIITNANDLDGNYDEATGWQRSSMGPNRDGWTGHGMLHQGQTASSSVSLDMATMDAMSATGDFSLEVVLGALYNDPRGGETSADKKRNRLPSSSGSAETFFYDMSSVSRYHEWRWMDATFSASSPSNTVRFIATATFSDGTTSDVTMSASWGTTGITNDPTGTGTFADPFDWTQDIGALPPPTAPGVYDIAGKLFISDTSNNRVLLGCDLAPEADPLTDTTVYCVTEATVNP